MTDENAPRRNETDTQKCADKNGSKVAQDRPVDKRPAPTEMELRVAKAIEDNANLCGGYGGPDQDFDEPPYLGDSLATARAAIRAMREPTDAMVDAAEDKAAMVIPFSHAYSTWQDMIDAALAGKS